MLAARYLTLVDSLPGKVAPVEQSHRHLQHLLHRFRRCSRAETPQGSLPACASGDVTDTTGATRIHPITGRRSLFPTPIPTPPSVGLTAVLPHMEERYGLTTFRKVDTNGLGALCPPVALHVHDRVLSRPCTRYSALLAQASQHLGLVAHHDVYREFAYAHHTIHPAPSPPDAGRYTIPSRFRCQSVTVGTVSEGSARVVTFPHIFVGYCRWNSRSGHYSVPDNQPCDLVSQ